MGNNGNFFHDKECMLLLIKLNNFSVITLRPFKNSSFFLEALWNKLEETVSVGSLK